MEIFILIIVILSLIINIVNLIKSKNQKADDASQDAYAAVLNLESKLNSSFSTLSEQISKGLNSVSSNETEAIIKSSEAQSKALLELSKNQAESFSQLRKELSENQSMQRKELSQANEQILTYVQTQLQQMQKSNAESLESIRKNVDEKLNTTLTERLNSSFSTISTMLDNVYKSLGEMKELSNGVSSLSRVFSNVKSRGTWAEYQLENILEQTIPGMFQKNFKPDKTKGEIVEFAIMIPAQNGQIVYLPVDSKFPTENYLRITEAADNCDKVSLEAAQKEFSKDIEEQAKKIKKYIKEPVTTPFAVMYLATEGLYNEAIRSKDGIVEKCQSEYNIMIAGPSTITALLNSLQVGFRAMKVNEKAEEIRKLLGVAKGQYLKFAEELEKVKKQLTTASGSIDKAINRNSQIVKKLKNIESVEMGENEFQLFGLQNDNLLNADSSEE